ncbi:DNA polymerase [Paenibacillus sp. J45TS6]|nr:DNA-processing protein DprA [Paenibacillus sp. J45TS6]GIP43726.1 DNA polymerase [Paenibacillus sp. J45TS6]
MYFITGFFSLVKERVESMEDRHILFGLQEMDGIGRKTIRRWMTSGNLLSDMLKYETQDWIQSGLSAAKAAVMKECFHESFIYEKLELLHKERIEIVTYYDKEYPILLKETADPPWVLYIKGNASLLHKPSIAMVGTRVPTGYGKKVGEVFASQLCKAGYTIVSGLARGIDSVCHEAAIRADGLTIAVLGAGLSHIYPAENHALASRIASSGLLVSEYPIHQKPRPGLFPERNRIIAGLSLGTLVVEADLRSGSLITADAALEAGRDVFAIPGPITSPKSHGTLNLIKQGAALVTKVEDITDEYKHVMNFAREDKPEQTGVHPEALLSASQQELIPELTEEERKVVDLLEAGPMTLDDFVDRLHLDFGHLHSVLLSLIIKKQIIQLPGAIYKLI